MQITRNQRNLPAVQSTTALSVREKSGASVVTVENPPRDVIRGVALLLLINPAPGRSPQEGQALASVYYKAVAGIPEAVAVYTLDWLQLHNPRNLPGYVTAPTPQDVHEACKKTHSDWRRWVCDFYFDPPYGKRFGLPTNNELLLNPNARRAQAEVSARIRDFQDRSRSAMAGPKPGEPGCDVPEDLQISFLRDEIERQMHRIDEIEAQEQRGEIPRYYNSRVEILVMPDDALECIPEAAFPDGTRETIKTKRAERAEAKRLAEERARAAEEERRHKIERERDEIDREITAIEADNVQSQEAARQELSARWDSVFFVRPNSDTAWHFREWVRHLNDIGRTDVIDQLLNQNSQLAVPSKCPAKDETELPVIIPIRDTHELRKRRQWL